MFYIFNFSQCIMCFLHWYVDVLWILDLTACLGSLLPRRTLASARWSRSRRWRPPVTSGRRFSRWTTLQQKEPRVPVVGWFFRKSKANFCKIPALIALAFCGQVCLVFSDFLLQLFARKKKKNNSTNFDKCLMLSELFGKCICDSTLVQMSEVV